MAGYPAFRVRMMLSNGLLKGGRPRIFRLAAPILAEISQEKDR